MSASQIERNLLAFDQTMIHEVGHVIGLGHSDDPVSLMYANPYNSLNHLRIDHYLRQEIEVSAIVRRVPFQAERIVGLVIQRSNDRIRKGTRGQDETE